MSNCFKKLSSLLSQLQFTCWIDNVFEILTAIVVSGDYIIDLACKLPNWGDVERFARTILNYINKEDDIHQTKLVNTSGN